MRHRPGLVLMIALAACGPTPPNESASDGASGSSTGGPIATTGTTGTTGTTTAPTTGDPVSTGTTLDVSTGVSSTEAATTHSFILGPDVPVGPSCVPPGSNLVAKECDPWTQDCPPGEKCVPYSGDGNADPESMSCRPIAREPVPVGGACEVAGASSSGCDNCELGAICWPVDPDTNTGECVAQCKGSPDLPDCSFVPGTGCWIAYDGVVQVCLPLCDPLEPNCADDELCLFAGSPDGFVCLPAAPGVLGQTFESCEFTDACAPGLLCVDSALAVECDPMVIGCCLPFCDVDAPVCPGMGQECAPWFENGEAPPGLEDVGLCELP